MNPAHSLIGSRYQQGGADMAMGSGSEGRGSMFRFDNRQIVVAGIIGGIALFLGFTRLGFIPVPIPLIGNATIMHIPAIVGGALEGPIVGLLAGAIFGIFSFLQADNPVFLNPVVPIVPRLLIGVVAWAVFVGLRRWSIDLASAVTVVIVRGVMLFRSGKTTAPENESDEERRY